MRGWLLMITWLRMYTTSFHFVVDECMDGWDGTALVVAHGRTPNGCEQAPAGNGFHAR